MKTRYSVNDYIRLLQTKIENCASIAEDDRSLPDTYDKTKIQWFIQRGRLMDKDTTLFKNVPKASQAMVLRENGEIEFYLSLRQPNRKNSVVEIVNS